MHFYSVNISTNRTTQSNQYIFYIQSFNLFTNYKFTTLISFSRLIFCHFCWLRIRVYSRRHLFCWVVNVARYTRIGFFSIFFCLPLFFKTTSRPETCVAVWFRFAIKVTPIRYDLVFTYIFGVFDNFWHERLWLYANYRN